MKPVLFNLKKHYKLNSYTINPKTATTTTQWVVVNDPIKENKMIIKVQNDTQK